MYLQIRNKGIVDRRSLTIIGASGTRFSNQPGTIGQFGSGSKLSIALLLRNGINPIICAGNLRMRFHSKPEYIDGKQFDQVCVTYQGKDVDGTSKTSTEDLGFCLQWGEQDWDKLAMALREFVANAIDASIEQGLDHSDIQLDVVDMPRCKAGYTTVYVPYTPEIEQVYRQLGTMFLHIGKPNMLNQKLIPKEDGNIEQTLIYKNGVLVNYIKERSVYDYNLGNELKLDESRNASDWDVRHACAKAIKDASASELVPIIQSVVNGKDVWESTLDSYYLFSEYDCEELKEKRSEQFQIAWKAVTGEKGVVVSNPSISSFVQGKGYQPIFVPSSWAKTLGCYGVNTETKVLTQSEQEGKQTLPPSEAMIDSINKVWNLLETFELTNGKDKPGCSSFYSILDGGAQTWGYYVMGEDKIHLHKDLTTGPLLNKVTLEEIVHYVTGADDNSRDIQDFLFRTIVEMAF